MTLSGLSYGGRVPSLEMQRLQAERAARERAEAIAVRSVLDQAVQAGQLGRVSADYLASRPMRVVQERLAALATLNTLGLSDHDRRELRGWVVRGEMQVTEILELARALVGAYPWYA